MPAPLLGSALACAMAASLAAPPLLAPWSVVSCLAALGGAPTVPVHAPVHVRAPERAGVVVTGVVRAASGAPLSAANVQITELRLSVATNAQGRYAMAIPAEQVHAQTVTILARAIGYAPQSQQVRLRGDTIQVHFTLQQDANRLSEVVVSGAAEQAKRERPGASARTMDAAAPAAAPSPMSVKPRGIVAQEAYRRKPVRGDNRRYAIADSTVQRQPSDPRDYDREQYDRIEDNPFLAVASNRLSTFSIDVDRASYGNVRRFVTAGRKPPADAVRIEELVNYFPYELRAPRGDDPIAITTEVAAAPWRPEHRLLRVALQAKRIDTAKLPPSNLVFLIDVSGSMQSPDKLPLVKQSLRLLVEQLRPEDRVALVVYAGAAGLVLESTPGADKAKIVAAIDRLEAGGSTAGGAGLELAYRVARDNRAERGNNRVILATDGDFNVGPSSDAEMERLVERKRAEGTYLTVLGFGTGNYQDAKMEKLAKRGNGNYAYVDDLAEARKVLVQEMGATLHTVADDVKLQLEFNPATVKGYRLIGYEDRLLRDEDFIDDRKDAGDVGAGHAVTALYEIVPVGARSDVPLRGTDPLRYGAPTESAVTRGGENELLFVQLRYKRPGESTSRLMKHAVRNEVSRGPSTDFRFAASVAAWGMLLRDSEHKGQATPDLVLSLARGALGRDEGGYRSEFVSLVERWRGNVFAER